MRTHRVEIFGQQYGLRAEVSEEHVRQVARLVDERMRDVASRTRAVATLQIAVLAALDLASDLLEEREARQALVRSVESRCAGLVRRIDEQVPAARLADDGPVPLLCS